MRQEGRLWMIVILTLGILSPASPLPIFRDSLPNGLIILTYEDHRLPMVDIAFTCRSGAAADPREKAGTANLCAEMLFRGTRCLSADSIASILDFLGAWYSSGTNYDHSYLYLRVLTKDLSTGLDLVAEMVREPLFPEGEFTLARDQVLSSARRAYDYPNSVVSMEFDRLLFAGHRYALPSAGDTSTIPLITREDLIQFHQANFVPNNCFIVIVGDVDHNLIKEEVSRRFADWQPGPVKPLSAPVFYLPEKTKVKLITRPDMNQAYIHFGHPGISNLDQDILATRLMSYILGGPPLSSRMGLAVREYAGLAYDVRCWFDRRLLSGAFRATVQTTKPEEAIPKMFAEIRKMFESGANQKELLKAHNYFTGSFPLSYSSNRGKLDRLTELEIYHFGTDWLATFPDRIRKITLEEVNAAARNRLKPGRYLMVIMGNVSRDQLNLPDVEWIE